MFLDHVEFSKNNYTNRVKIRTKEGSKWLTVPIPKGYSHARICDVPLLETSDWVKTHIKTLLGQYKTAPYFDETLLNNIYNVRAKLICEFNIHAIQTICKHIGINTPTIRSSDLGVTSDLKSTELLLEIVQRVGGTVYLSGAGAKTYLDTTLFEDNHKRVVYTEFQEKEYTQNQPGFISGLTVLDKLFNTETVFD